MALTSQDIDPQGYLEGQFGPPPVIGGGGTLLQTTWGGFYLGMDRSAPSGSGPTVTAPTRAKRGGGKPAGVRALTGFDKQVVSTKEAAYAEFYTWSDLEVNEFRNRLVAAGVVRKDAGPDVLSTAWKDLVDLSAEYQIKGRKVSPFDVISMFPGADQGTGENFTGEKTRTDKSIQRIDPKAAEGAVRDLMREMLGHDPSSSELRRLSGAFRNYFESRPQVSRTTTSFQEGEVTGTVSEIVEPGGSVEGATEELEQQLMQDDEWGAYQATTTYFPALEQMMGGGF